MYRNHRSILALLSAEIRSRQHIDSPDLMDAVLNLAACTPTDKVEKPYRYPHFLQGFRFH